MDQIRTGEGKQQRSECIFREMFGNRPSPHTPSLPWLLAAGSTIVVACEELVG